MKGPPFGTALSIVAYWDGLPTPSGVRHAESHALRAHVAVVFAPGRALEWKLISASSSLARGETPALELWKQQRILHRDKVIFLGGLHGYRDRIGAENWRRMSDESELNFPDGFNRAR
jgi:hypothetical protein